MTSTKRTGSQKEIGNPMRGIGFEHVQKNVRGFCVSSPEVETRMPPMVMGKIQLQQISVMGLTNRPLHEDEVDGMEVTIRIRNTHKHL